MLLDQCKSKINTENIFCTEQCIQFNLKWNISGFHLDLIWLTFIKSYTISKEKRIVLKRKMKMSFENVSISDPTLLDLGEWLHNCRCSSSGDASLQPKGGHFAPQPSCSTPPAPSPFPHLILAPFWRCAPRLLHQPTYFTAMAGSCEGF